MIARIIRWSVANPLLILFATVFVIGAGIYAVIHTPLDAIPDLSDTQVIVYTEYPGQAPQVVEDQVTYPLTTALLSVPRSDEHTSELQSLMRNSYAVVCLKKKTPRIQNTDTLALK